MTGNYSKEVLKPIIIDGINPITCIFCDSEWCIEFDLTQHLIEEHRMDLVELPIGKCKMPFRVAYAIDKGRRGPKPAVSTSNPNFDNIDSELRAAKNRWTQTNRPLELVT